MLPMLLPDADGHTGVLVAIGVAARAAVEPAPGYGAVAILIAALGGLFMFAAGSLSPLQQGANKRESGARSTLLSMTRRALMERVPIEPPVAGVAAFFSRELPEFGDLPLGVVAAREPLEILPNELIEGLAHRLGLPAGAPDEPLVDGQGDLHAHMILLPLDMPIDRFIIRSHSTTDSSPTVRLMAR
jgi:hypothetical protein